MKISAKGDYATRALQDLALHYNKGPVPIEDIARRQAVPVRYLEQILLILKQAGFLESRRGVNGGYSLARHPREITLGQIIRAVDGPLAPIFCVDDAATQECSQEPICVLREVWAEVHRAISAIVDKTTLEDICDRIRLREEKRNLTYHI